MNFFENEHFERALEEALTHFEEDSEIESKDPLFASIRYSLLAPGKRIRPRLSLCVSQLLNIPGPAALATAISIEMLHCFTLIHDDLPCLDNDDFRRGQPSNHRRFSEATALLAGDALIFLAFEVFQNSAQTIPSELWIKGLRRLCQTMGPRGVIGGQTRELFLNADSATLPQLLKVHALKTGALFEAALLIPLDFSGIPPSSPPGEALTRFARNLGSAFQIADDLEDQEEAQSPTSLLFYPDHLRVIDRVLTEARSSHQDLKSHWGSATEPLITMHQEVLNSIRSRKAS